MAGTFIGSSYVYATARDYARFGLLYLRDSVSGAVEARPRQGEAIALNEALHANA